MWLQPYRNIVFMKRSTWAAIMLRYAELMNSVSYSITVRVVHLGQPLLPTGALIAELLRLHYCSLEYFFLVSKASALRKKKFIFVCSHILSGTSVCQCLPLSLCTPFALFRLAFLISHMLCILLTVSLAYMNIVASMWLANCVLNQI